MRAGTAILACLFFGVKTVEHWADWMFVSHAALAAVCLVMMRYGLKMTLDSAMLGSITIKNLVFPEWWLLWPLPACFGLLAIEFAFRFDRLIRSEPGRRIEATSVG